jgi:hypothetical protein
MEGATLSDAVLAEANLNAVKLTKCVVNGANFQYADLRNADVRGTDLSRAKYLELSLIDGTTESDPDTQWPPGFAPPDPSYRDQRSHRAFLDELRRGRSRA